MNNDENKIKNETDIQGEINEKKKEKKVHLGKLRQQQAKAARLTKALRENLFKRKAQARERIENKDKG